jgi:selenocysteine lyase/cysteine desulfurase
MPSSDEDREQLISAVRDGLIGTDEVVRGPFGPRRITYADYTASGRSLTFLEEFLRAQVLPRYGNTHTETSETGRQTTTFREDARRMIKRVCGATDDDALIFCGSGSTAAIDRLITILGLKLSAELDERFDLRSRIPTEARPVVFIGPYEHHSNELSWRESIADVVVIHEDAAGHIDLAELERVLEEHRDRPLRIGSFSAASNVTGIKTDVHAVARLLHRHGALSFWDFAAAAPYVDIDMNPGQDDEALDAVFLSPHKLVGGPGTPGVLLVKRRLLHNRVPAMPGGGTVEWVTEEGQRYHDEPELREEGGTPAIVESIRAGLVFQLKEAVGAAAIQRREETYARRAIRHWQQNPAVNVLGPHDADRVAIISFTVRYDDERWLHHELVGALLNDLFGIQARGGCSCAGPYGARLLGIDLPTIRRHTGLIDQGWQGLKPGWTRVGFNYFITDDEADFIIRAVDLVAAEGWKLLPLYHFDARTGQWAHRHAADHAPLHLDDVRYVDGRMAFAGRPAVEHVVDFDGYLEQAREIIDAAVEEAVDIEPEARPSDVPVGFEELLWFPLHDEVIRRLKAGQQVAGSR